MPQLCESWHMWRCHVTRIHMCLDCIQGMTWLINTCTARINDLLIRALIDTSHFVTHLDTRYVTLYVCIYKYVMTDIYSFANESRHTSNLRLSRATFVWVMTPVEESCHTHKCDVTHSQMSNVTRMIESRHICWESWHMWRSHVTFGNTLVWRDSLAYWIRRIWYIHILLGVLNTPYLTEIRHISAKSYVRLYLETRQRVMSHYIWVMSHNYIWVMSQKYAIFVKEIRHTICMYI